MAAGRVQHQARNRERVHALAAFGVDPVVALVERLLPAHARADEAGRALAVFALEGHAGIPYRLARRHDRELAEPVEQRELFRRKVRLRVEVLDLGPDLHVELARVDDGQRTDDRPPLPRRLPELGHGFAGRA